MPTIAAVAAFLEQLAPPRLAEEWDNVGLLVGHRDQAVKKLMTCLTVTPASAAEAIEARADLIVTHHPIPFTAIKRLTADTTAGRLLLDLIAARVAVYSAHTAFDSAAEGVNQRLAEGLELRGIAPLMPHVEGQGTGRWGSSGRAALARRTGPTAETVPLDRTLADRGPAGAAGPHCGGGVRRGRRVARSGPRAWLRRDGAWRGPLPHLSGGRGRGHWPALARPLCQRAVRRWRVWPKFLPSSSPMCRFGPAGAEHDPIRWG